jgi:hypothetical protein
MRGRVAGNVLTITPASIQPGPHYTSMNFAYGRDEAMVAGKKQDATTFQRDLSCRQ